MTVISTRDRILNVVKAWDEQYPKTEREEWYEDKRVILRKLEALDLKVCSAEDVETVIGNRSWTRMHCNECSGEVGILVMVGEPEDYESRTASLCIGCIQKALSLMGNKV